MAELTEKQQSVLDFIKGYFRKNHYAPTQAEIGAFMGVSSKNTVFAMIEQLEKHGCITYRANAPRSIRIDYHRPAGCSCSEYAKDQGRASVWCNTCGFTGYDLIYEDVPLSYQKGSGA